MSDAVDAGFQLNPHGRYSHDPAYVQRVLADVGLQLAAADEVTLRMERGEPVAGLLVSAQKPAPRPGGVGGLYSADRVG